MFPRIKMTTPVKAPPGISPESAPPKNKAVNPTRVIRTATTAYTILITCKVIILRKEKKSPQLKPLLAV